MNQAERSRRSRTPRRPSRSLAAIAVAALVLTLGAVGVSSLGTGAVAADPGTVLLEDDFMSGTTVASSYVVGGKEGAATVKACLTAGSSTSQTPVPGCGGAVDADGSGALRLTRAVGTANGYLLYNKQLPTKAGLDITFNQYQYGGNGADGISFFLTDGAYTLAAPGAMGGSLGYHNSNAGSGAGQPGVAHALLGVGFDAWGNFTIETNNAGCTTYGGSQPSLTSTVGVRGPGDGTTGYCVLGAPVKTTSVGAPALRQSVASRPAPIVTRVRIDPPSDPDPKVTVFLNGVQVTQVAEPAVLAGTPTFKFGWAASTGGSTDIHEINFLKVQSVLPIRSDLRLSATATSVPSNDSGTVTWTARADGASGPVPAGEDVTLSATAPAGTEFGTVTAPGWACTVTDGTDLSCVYEHDDAAIDPATTLPAVTAAVARTASGTSGTSTFTATVASATDDGTLTADNTAAATVRWNPVTSPVDAGEVTASSTPASVTVDPVVVGTAPYTYAVSAPADPSVGDVAVVGGRLVLTPAAGASGLLSATYTATDGAAGVSNASAVSLLVRPVVVGTTATTTVDEPVTVTVPFTGSGPWASPQWTATDGSTATFATNADGDVVLTITPAAGFSGVDTGSFSVADRHGLRTDVEQVAVTVAPVAGSTAAVVTLDADGDATATVAVPAPSGTGPFAYELVGGALSGASATIDAGGQVTVVADRGETGVHEVRYRVQGADGVWSAPQDVTVTVRPYVGPVAPTSGTADATTTSDAPVAHGSGPVTWGVTAPARTSATAGADGAVTFDPEGHSGTFVLVLTATSNGTQTSVPVVVEIAPVAYAVDDVTTASDAPVASVLSPAAPLGDGPFSLTLVQGLDPARGTAVVDGGDVEITPAPGVSGRLVVRYTATDSHLGTSAPVTATLDVRPVAHDRAASLVSGATASVALPTPTGTGPFTYELLDGGPAAAGVVTLNGGTASVLSSPAWSGTWTARYRVLDADGLASDPAELVLTVAPVSPGGQTGTDVTVPGTTGSPATGPTPAPSGTGPFTFEIVTGPTPDQGTATIDPATGVITFVPAPGFSGTVEVTYRSTDAHGTPSAPAVVEFDVAPKAVPAPSDVPGHDEPVRVPAGTSVRIQLPTPVGSGPFTYELVDGPSPAQATVTLDPTTGELVVVPTPGTSGHVPVTYQVVDRDGLASDPVVVAIDVAPVGGDASATVEHAGEVTFGVPTPTGTGPFRFVLTSTVPAEQGTLELDEATGAVTFHAADGFTGTVTATYVVVDADGVTSDPSRIRVEVLPPAAPDEGTDGGSAPEADDDGPATLPVTGSDALLVGSSALALLLAGAGLVILRRRSDRG
ncbi:Ig-like domain-containing protein [Cellulomonas massiliensis]|uniref:Ig-like domain-containing protein n=1 Tax=Cellulomonas massiliensis TaxID=1465811 RepID=UPI0002F41463|nr:Ig-like domain-containing protein [Cellulomonas massiliensis]